LWQDLPPNFASLGALPRQASKQEPNATNTSESSPVPGSLLSPWAPFSMQKKKNGRFLFLRPSRIAWQTLLVTKLRLVYNKPDLLSQLGEQIRFVSRFLAVLLGSSKPFRSNFGLTHVVQELFRSRH
jgi:hypothetical protein